MELSRELFDQIVSHLKGAASSSDKRHKPRVGLRKRVDLTPLNAPGSPPLGHTSVMVRDLSPSGIGLMNHQRMDANSFFAIRLPSSAIGALVAVYKVRHCDLIEDGLYRIGAQLVKVCDIDAEPAAVDPAEHPAGAAPGNASEEKSMKAPDPEMEAA